MLSVKQYYKFFEVLDENGEYNNCESFKKEYAFQKEVFQKWIKTLEVNKEYTILRPNHTCRNGSARFINNGVCKFLGMVTCKSWNGVPTEYACFLKANGKSKIYLSPSDLTIHTSEFFRKEAEKLINK